MTGPLPAKNTAHHRRKITGLPAIRPGIVNPVLQRAVASLRPRNDTSDLPAQHLSAQAILPQVAAQPRYRHPRIKFHVSINIHLLRGSDDSHAVLRMVRKAVAIVSIVFTFLTGCFRPEQFPAGSEGVTTQEVVAAVTGSRDVALPVPEYLRHTALSRQN